MFCYFSSDAQLSLQYTNTRQAPASHNVTILDQVTDNNGNIYIVYSDDPAKYHLVSKINAAGTSLWTDTIAVPGFPQVNVITAKVNLGQNKLYILFTGYGVPSPAGPIVAIYDLNGNYLNGFNASTLTNVWTYGVHGVHEKTNGNILVYYSYGDQFTTDDTMYVKEFTPNFSPVWNLKYSLPKLTWYCPNTLDAAGNFYFTYTNDSVVGANHSLKSYTRKADNNGNVLWTNTMNNVANRCIKKMPNGDIAMAGNNNPAGSILGNNTGDAKISRLNDTNGDTVWTKTYNGANNEREDINSLEVDQLNNIYVAGTEDMHDYNPMINKGFLQKYNSAGQLQYDNKIPATSGTQAVYLDALANINTLSIIGNNTVHLKKILASTGITIDSMSSNVTFTMGIGMTSNNTDDDIFFTYSEGHCGANHLEVRRFCTRAVCGDMPQGTEDITGNTDMIHLYPNPANDILYIKNTGSDKIDHVNVYSITGMKMSAQLNNKQINISGLAKGIYLVQIDIAGKKEIQRFVKE